MLILVWIPSLSAFPLASAEMKDLRQGLWCGGWGAAWSISGPGAQREGLRHGQMGWGTVFPWATHQPLSSSKSAHWKLCQVWTGCGLVLWSLSVLETPDFHLHLALPLWKLCLSDIWVTEAGTACMSGVGDSLARGFQPGPPTTQCLHRSLVKLSSQSILLVCQGNL